MKIIQKISDIIGKVLDLLVIFFLIMMTVLMFSQFIGRFLFKNGIFWAEELSRFTMVTMVYLGSALACKNKDHIRVTLLEEYLKGTALKLLRIGIAGISIAFLVIVARFGFLVLPVVSTQISANLQITMNLVYMMIPISSCIMIFYILVEIIEIIVTPEKAAMEKIVAQAEGSVK